MLSSDWWDVSKATGITVVIEGIPSMRDEDWRRGKMRRITIATRIIALLMGAAFCRNSLVKIQVRSKIRRELKAKLRILSAVSGF
jgi:hypothetical protein